jgi:hypothetical protein
MAGGGSAVNVKLDCKWDEKTGTLFIKAPAEIGENCTRISLSHGLSTFTTLFTECGYAFGMCKCRSEEDDRKTD